MSISRSRPARPFASMPQANFRSASSSNFERSSTPMNSSRSSRKSFLMRDLVQIAVHIAAEIAFDVAGFMTGSALTKMPGAVDAADALADQRSVHEHTGVVAPRVWQARPSPSSGSPASV